MCLLHFSVSLQVVGVIVIQSLRNFSDSSRIFTWGICHFLSIVCEGAAWVERTGEAATLLRVAQTACALGRAGDETFGTGVSRGFSIGGNGAFAALFNDELMILCIFNVLRVFHIVQSVL